MGRLTWGECQRSGKRLLRNQLVYDGQNPELLVAPDEFDPYHPQLRIAYLRDERYNEGRVVDPAPEGHFMVAPVLSAVLATGDIRLTWTAGNSEALTMAYQVWRGVSGATPALYATVTVERDYLGEITNDPLTYLDTAVTDDLTYTYYVLLVDANSASIASNTATIEAEAALVAPVLSVGTIAASTIQLNWTAAVGGVPPYEAYEVWRSLDGVAYSLLDSTNLLTLTDTGLTPETLYWYYVIAEDAVGQRSQSNIVNPETSADTANKTLFTAGAQSPGDDRGYSNYTFTGFGTQVFGTLISDGLLLATFKGFANDFETAVLVLEGTSGPPAANVYTSFSYLEGVTLRTYTLALAFSTTTDGNLRRWAFDVVGSRLTEFFDYELTFA